MDGVGNLSDPNKRFGVYLGAGIENRVFGGHYHDRHAKSGLAKGIFGNYARHLPMSSAARRNRGKTNHLLLRMCGRFDDKIEAAPTSRETQAVADVCQALR